MFNLIRSCLLSIVWLSLINVTYGQQTNILTTPVLLPYTDTDYGVCISAAIKMAFKDIEREEIKYTANNRTKSYKLLPEYKYIGNTAIDTVEALTQLHKFNSKTFFLPTFMKRSTIGPPLDDQTNLYADFCQILPNIQISYSQITEPYDSLSSLYFQTPPSIIGQFQAVRAFMEVYEWKQAIVVYDFSNNRYRLSTNLLSDILEKKIHNKSITVVATTRVRSNAKHIEFNELQQIPHFDARIIILLAGLHGVRQTFCEAYNLKFQKSNFVWILFEILPEGWASDKYNSKIIDGKKEREINCSEDEMLSVTDRIIYIVKGGIRRDNFKTVSNMTGMEYEQKLKDQIKNNTIKCGDRAAYAYDAIWTLVKAHQVIMSTSLHDIFINNFVYLLGLSQANKVSKAVEKTEFEGITGHISFIETEYSTNVRIGYSSIYVYHSKDKENVQKGTLRVGDYNTRRKKLHLESNANMLLFNGVVPLDRAIYIKRDYVYPEEFIIVIWLVSFAGVAITIVLLSIVILCGYNTTKSPISGGMATLAIDSVISFGCILCYISLVVYGIDTRLIIKENIPNICYSFLCTLSIGFTLTFGALFAKTWWKYKSFSAPSAISKQTGTKISEWSLFILIAMFLVVDIIVLICWTVTSPFEVKVHEANKIKLNFAIEIEQINKCSCDNMNEFTIGLFCYKGVLLVFGVFLAWQTNFKLRGTPSYSKTVSLAIYNTALVSTVGVICVSLLRDTDHRHALYAIIAVCVILSTSTTLAMIYVPKLSKIFKFDISEEEDSNSSSDDDTNKTKFNKFTLEKLRRRVTNRTTKLPSVSSVQNSTMSISTTTSTIDSRRPTTLSETDIDNKRQSSFTSDPHRGVSFTTETSSNVGSFVSYNPSFVQSSPVLEVPTEEDEPMEDIIIEQNTVIEIPTVVDTTTTDTSNDDDFSADIDVSANTNIDKDIVG